MHIRFLTASSVASRPRERKNSMHDKVDVLIIGSGASGAVVSVLLLAPPAFCMGMMFPLGLSIWRRHSELLPFFWSANGITSMLASVLGMALSIEFGIAKTYALGTCLYVVCAVMIVRSRNTARSVETPKLRLQGEIAPAASPAAVSTQSS